MLTAGEMAIIICATPKPVGGRNVRLYSVRKRLSNNCDRRRSGTDAMLGEAASKRVRQATADWQKALCLLGCGIIG